MAAIYDTFESIPVNRNVRKRLFRSARMGTRPAPVIPDIGDAVKTITAAAAYKDGWQGSTNEPSNTTRTSWNTAKGP